MWMQQQQIRELEDELRKTKERLSPSDHQEESLRRTSKELRDSRQRERDMAILLSENKKRIQGLEGEVRREKESQSKAVDSLMMLSKQLEAAKMELEESKIEVASLRDQIGSSSSSSKEAEERIRSRTSEIESLKKELKSASDAEEKSSKAMEDLALALSEVAAEANQAKEKLEATKIELEHVKAESEQLKIIIRDAEERHEKLLHDARKEAELHRNTAERLRVEAEESLLAWNGKEMGFVGCIKRAEEEKAIARHESDKLKESLIASETMTRAAREETYKLRDILKQAINEANAAKAASGIAREENSQLKDCLSEKEEALYFLTKENERLRISEAAAKENIKQLKRLLSSVNADRNGILLNPSDEDSEENNSEDDARKKGFRFDLEDLKFVNLPEEDSREKVLLHEDPDVAEALKGSIFDANAETPKSDSPGTAKSSSSAAAQNHRRGYSLAFTEDGRDPNSVEFDSFERAHDDSDIERNYSQRKVRTMFRRVGDILMIRRSFNKKEMSVAE